MMIAVWGVGGSNTDPLNNRSHTIVRSRHHILDDDIHASCDATGAEPHGNRQETIKLPAKEVGKSSSILFSSSLVDRPALRRSAARTLRAAARGSDLGNSPITEAATSRNPPISSHPAVTHVHLSRSDKYKVYTSGYNKT